jgi:hypothetical protein
MNYCSVFIIRREVSYFNSRFFIHFQQIVYVCFLPLCSFYLLRAHKWPSISNSLTNRSVTILCLFCLYLSFFVVYFQPSVNLNNNTSVGDGKSPINTGSTPPLPPRGVFVSYHTKNPDVDVSFDSEQPNQAKRELRVRMIYCVST